MTIDTREDLLRAAGEAKVQLESYQCRILVCSGTVCVATGSEAVYEKFLEIAMDAPDVQVEFNTCGGQHTIGVKHTGCQGVCELGPLVRIQKGDKVIQYVQVKPKDCKEISTVPLWRTMCWSAFCISSMEPPAKDRMRFRLSQSRPGLL